MKLDFKGLRCKPLEADHCATRDKLLFRVDAEDSETLKDFNKRTSSAYIYRWDVIESLGRSATNKLKRMGPRTDP